MTQMRVKKLSFDNDVGGTEYADGPFVVKVEESWQDDETGGRFKGRLISPVDVEKLRKQGTTKHGPKKAAWNPARIYFSEFDVLDVYSGDCGCSIGGQARGTKRAIIYCKLHGAAAKLFVAIGPLLANAALADGNGCRTSQESDWADTFLADPKGCLEIARLAVQGVQGDGPG